MIAIGDALVAIAVAAVISFWLGFCVATLMAMSTAADRRMEAMRRKHIGDVAGWLDRKQNGA